jgi:hypothetical protein
VRRRHRKSWTAIAVSALILLSSAALHPAEMESGSLHNRNRAGGFDWCPTSGFSSSCPNPQGSYTGCTCISSSGSISGKPFGNGYGEVYLDIDGFPLQSGCSDYNGSMFIIASGDLQELDFSGSFCATIVSPVLEAAAGEFSGTYAIATSAAGYSSTGRISGVDTLTSGGGNQITLHFNGPVSK